MLVMSHEIAMYKSYPQIMTTSLTLHLRYSRIHVGSRNTWCASGVRTLGLLPRLTSLASNIATARLTACFCVGHTSSLLEALSDRQPQRSGLSFAWLPDLPPVGNSLYDGSRPSPEWMASSRKRERKGRTPRNSPYGTTQDVYNRTRADHSFTSRLKRQERSYNPSNLPKARYERSTKKVKIWLPESE